MFQKIAIILSSLLLCFQAHAKRPKWVDNPADFCGVKYLCGVGEATGRMGAEAEARKSVSNVFQTKIKGTTKVTNTAESQTKGGYLTNAISSEDVFTQVEAVTEQVLEGVEIKEYFENDEAVFALARLNKRKASKRLKSKIKDVDEDIAIFYKDGKRGSLNKALKKFEVRRNLDERHEFLSGSRIPAAVTKAMILKKKREKAALNVVILLNTEEIGSTGELKQAIIDELINSAYKVTMSKEAKHDYVVDSKLAAEKEYFNVEGWEKYKFLLSFNSLDKNGQKKGSLTFKTTQTGRDFTQAYERALPQIKSFIQDNIDDLNID